MPTLRRTGSWLLALWWLAASPAVAEVRTQSVIYRDGSTVLEGYLAYEADGADKRPGVLVFHEWKGLNDYAKRRARELAALGYVAFAADMYGRGVVAATHEEAAKLSGALRQDRAAMRRRAQAALDTLQLQLPVDAERIAAIGYCFGGTTALELARSGAPLRGVASFHGALNTPHPEDAARIQGRVLVLHGADDPHITPEEVGAFDEAMGHAGVDYRIIQYAGAVHSFTVPEAGHDPSAGAAYNAEADRASWEALREFLEDIFR